MLIETLIISKYNLFVIIIFYDFFSFHVKGLLQMLHTGPLSVDILQCVDIMLSQKTDLP